MGKKAQKEMFELEDAELEAAARRYCDAVDQIEVEKDKRDSAETTIKNRLKDLKHTAARVGQFTVRLDTKVKAIAKPSE